MTANWVVITTINPPSAAVRAFAQMPDWQVVVVGDQKTPEDWACENVVYLRPSDQDKLSFTLAQHLPWNHYGRKMLGYLYAMRQGADVIADLDDDTLPLANWGCPDFDGSWRMLYGPPKFINIYRQFADVQTWPRGFPLGRIHQSTAVQQTGTQKPVGVWQSLVDGDPDVDAIYRLTVGYGTYFKDMSPIVLEKGTFCPFNSQNTFWRKETFPLMYLPTSVNSRFSDILRGYVAQPIMWADGYQLGFTTATATQHRNPHDLMQDFRDEMDMYLHAEEVARIAEDGPAGLGLIYARLRARGIADEYGSALNAWQRDVEVLL